MLKINNRSTRARCEICSKLKIKTVERWRHSALGWMRFVTWAPSKHFPAQNQQ